MVYIVIITTYNNTRITLCSQGLLIMNSDVKLTVQTIESGRFEMKSTNDLINSLALGNNIAVDDIPKVDLYIDQVIELFDNNYNETKRNPKEKILTKTMINNYAKGKVFFPLQSKKYSKEHIMLINLIYQLKGALSINDIKETLAYLNDNVVNEGFDLEHFYESYLTLDQKNCALFEKDVEQRGNEVREEVAKLAEENTAQLERTLMIASLVDMSNLYRRAAEKLVDEIAEENDEVK